MYDKSILEWSSDNNVLLIKGSVGGSLLDGDAIGNGIRTSLPNGSNSVMLGGCIPIRRLLRLGCWLAFGGSIVCGERRFT